MKHLAQKLTTISNGLWKTYTEISDIAQNLTDPENMQELSALNTQINRYREEIMEISG